MDVLVQNVGKYKPGGISPSFRFLKHFSNLKVSSKKRKDIFPWFYCCIFGTFNGKRIKKSLNSHGMERVEMVFLKHFTGRAWYRGLHLAETFLAPEQFRSGSFGWYFFLGSIFVIFFSCLFFFPFLSVGFVGINSSLELCFNAPKWGENSPTFALFKNFANRQTWPGPAFVPCFLPFFVFRSIRILSGTFA